MTITPSRSKHRGCQSILRDIQRDRRSAARVIEKKLFKEKRSDKANVEKEILIHTSSWTASM